MINDQLVGQIVDQLVWFVRWLISQLVGQLFCQVHWSEWHQLSNLPAVESGDEDEWEDEEEDGGDDHHDERDLRLGQVLHDHLRIQSCCGLKVKRAPKIWQETSD